MSIFFHGRSLIGERGPAGPDGNPIGTVISFMGKTAPKDYLICDGSQYPIEDYPHLAEFFEEQFGSKSHFGGDGETTFNVPDMSNPSVNTPILYCIKAIETGPSIEEYDTVVDSCNWHVRKWGNGYCEFLGSKVYSNVDLNTPWGSSGLYSSSTGQAGPSFPFKLVKKYIETQHPDSNHIGDNAQSSGGLIVTSGSYTMEEETLNKANNFIFIRQTTQLNRSIRVYFYICGLWK